MWLILVENPQKNQKSQKLVPKTEPRDHKNSLKTKNKTHISLGNDCIPWISVTKSSMKPFDRVEETESSNKESKYSRSTVLDYPDMEKVPMTSVHQQGNLSQWLTHLDFSANSQVDPKSLTVDTLSFIKDLKSTHFSVCSTY